MSEYEGMDFSELLTRLSEYLYEGETLDQVSDRVPKELLAALRAALSPTGPRRTRTTEEQPSVARIYDLLGLSQHLLKRLDTLDTAEPFPLFL